MKLLIRIIVASLAAICMLSAATPAFAQDKTWPKIREELPSDKLKRGWDSATELRDDAQWSAARVQYEDIYQQTRNARVLFNLGICWKELGQFSQAIGAWEKQLANRSKLPPKEAERAENAIKIVQPFVTTLELTTNQTGATVFLKGIEVGKTPVLGTLPIDSGQVEVRLEKKGFATALKMLDIPKGKPMTLTLNMSPETPTVKVTITVTGAASAMLYMDGTELGTAPFSGEVPTGKHTFKATQRGFVDAEQTSTVVANENLRITLAMAKLENEGKVKITTDHPDAVIRIDGVKKGRGTWEGLLHAGGHSLEISKEGYDTYTADIAVAVDQERVINAILKDDMTAHWVYWAIAGVAVAAGAGITSYFVLRPAEESDVTGTLAPGVIPTNIGLTLFSF